MQINLTILLVLLHNRHTFSPETPRVSSLPEATEWGHGAADPDTHKDEDKEEPLKRRKRMRGKVSKRPQGSQCPCETGRRKPAPVVRQELSSHKPGSTHEITEASGSCSSRMSLIMKSLVTAILSQNIQMAGELTCQQFIRGSLLSSPEAKPDFPFCFRAEVLIARPARER